MKELTEEQFEEMQALLGRYKGLITHLQEKSHAKLREEHLKDIDNFLNSL